MIIVRTPRLIERGTLATGRSFASPVPARSSRKGPARTVLRAPAEDRARPGRAVDWAAALLSALALADSGLEHYRGSFHNKTMYLPLGVAAVTLAACLRGAAPRPTESGPGEAVVSALAVATGIVGTGFHLYNVGKRPGGFSWLNLFYAAPLGAPATLSMAGLLHALAARIRAGRKSAGGAPIGAALAALVSAGLLGSSLEAALLHYRGAFQNRAMFIPVTVAPVAGGVLGAAALRPAGKHPVARWLLRIVAATGVIGMGFHAWGIRRAMGGWRNWSQNLLNGPPLAAPPAFIALAAAGLAALGLIEEDAE